MQTIEPSAHIICGRSHVVKLHSPAFTQVIRQLAFPRQRALHSSVSRQSISQLLEPVQDATHSFAPMQLSAQVEQPPGQL